MRFNFVESYSYSLIYNIIVMKGGKAIQIEPIQFIVYKIKDRAIDIDKINEKDRLDILNRDWKIKTREFNSLFDKLNDTNNEIRILNSFNIETIQLLMEQNWCVPITNDFYLVNDKVNKTNIKIITTSEFEKKLKNIDYTKINTISNEIKPYENIQTEIEFRSNVSRMGAREVSPDTYDRSILIGETISLTKFIVNLNLIDKKNSNYEKNNNCYSSLLMENPFLLRDYKIYNNQYKLKNINKIFEIKNLSLSKSINQLVEIYKIINNIKYFYDNTFSLLYQQKQAKLSNKYNYFEVFRSDKEIELVKNQYPLFDGDMFNFFYTKYPNFDTYSDTIIGRTAFLFNNNRYKDYAYYLLLNNDKNSISSNLLNNLKKDYDEYLYVNELLFYLNTRRIEKAINDMIVGTAIYIQLNKQKYEKIINRALTENKDIKSLLSKKELEIVETYIKKNEELRASIKANKCPHFKLRDYYDANINLDIKNKTFKELVKNFIGKPDPETMFLYCTQCGYNLGCNHELLQYYEKEQELEDKYYIKDGVICKCKFCNRKIKDANIFDQQIYFDKNGNPEIGEKIENISDDYINVRNLVSEAIITCGIQNYEKIYKLTDEVYSFIYDKYESLKKINVSSNDLKNLKNIYAVAYIYANILIKIMNKKYKLWNQTSNLKTLNDYLLEIINIIKNNNKKYFNFLSVSGLKSKFISALKSAYNKLISEETIINKSKFKIIAEKYGDKLKNLVKIASGTPPGKLKANDNINDYLNNAFKYNFWLFLNNKSFNYDDICYSNELIEDKIYHGIEKWANMSYFPSKPLDSLTRSIEYSSYDYDEKGNKIDWEYIIINNKEIKKNLLKDNIKQLKDNYDLNYSVEDFDINPLNINTFKKDYKSSNGLIKSKIKKTKISNYLISQQNELNCAKELIKSWCIGDIEGIDMNGYIINCSPSVSDIKKVISYRSKKEIIKDEKIPIITDYDSLPDNIDSKTINEKGIKLIAGNDTIIRDFYSNYGTSIHEYEENKNKLKEMMYTPDRIRYTENILEYKLKRLKNESQLNRVNILINIIIILQQSYIIIHNGSLVSCNKSPGLFYLCDFIKKKKEKDFNKKLDITKYNIINYNKIKNNNKINYEKKIIILINILIDLSLFIINNNILGHEYEFIKTFIYNAINVQSLTDISSKKYNEINKELDLQKRRNLDIFLKMTPTEKIEKGFPKLNLDEQIDIINEENREKEEERDIIDYSQENEMGHDSLDDELYQDDDYQFMNYSLGEDNFVIE